MRICVYYDLAEGGALRALRGLLPALARRHRVTAVRPRGAAPLRARDASGAAIAERVLPAGASTFSPDNPFYMLHKLTDLVDTLRVERAESDLARELDGERCDLLLVHSARHRGAPALLARAMIPTVYYCTEPLRLTREPWIEGAAPAPLARLGRGVLAPASRWRNRRDVRHTQRARHVIANSDYTAAELLRLSGREASVVRPGIDPRPFASARERARSAPPPRRYWLAPGALLPQKGQAFVIRAAACVPAERRPLLVLAGYAGLPGYRRFLQRLAAELSVRVEMRRDVAERAMADLHAGAELSLIGAIGEPLGLVSLESQAAGTPVVVVREGGLPETVADGETGLVVARDERLFGEAALCLADDAPRRERMGAAGAARVERAFSIRGAGDRLVEAIEAIAEGALRA